MANKINKVNIFQCKYKKIKIIQYNTKIFNYIRVCR